MAHSLEGNLSFLGEWAAEELIGFNGSLYQVVLLGTDS